jgi:hypothetical protein
MEKHNAYPTLAARNSDPLDHPDHAAAPLEDESAVWHCAPPRDMPLFTLVHRERESPASRARAFCDA